MGNRRAPRVRLLGAVALAALGCAHTTGGAAPWRDLATDAGTGWGALLDGRSGDAASAFSRRLDGAKGTANDALALFGRGTVAFDRGDHARAVADYARLLEQAARSSINDAAWTLAPVAAGRLLALLSDLPDGSLVRQVEDQVLSLPRARLPWIAQLELGRLGDRAARRRMDPALIDRLALMSGCARLAYQSGVAGRLPRIDLDAAAGTAAVPVAAWRTVAGAGCRLSVSSWDGRSGVQLVKAAVEVTAAGTFDLVLDSASEARWRIDGGVWQGHGLAVATGPTVAATALRLSAGRHTIELRLGTLGGDAELSLMLLPPAGGAAARFVDPREPASNAAATVLGPLAPAAMVVAPLPEGARAILDYVAAYVTDRVGDADGAAAAVARLAARPRFAAGLVLAGGVAQNDVTRPSGFARDAGQTLLRRAVTIDPMLARAWNALANLQLDDDHPRESIDDARAAVRAAPEWPAPELTLAAALAARGLEFDADQALDRAASKVATRPATLGRASCAVGEALARRAEQRRDVRAREVLFDQLRGCDSRLDGQVDRLRGRGDIAGALAWLRQVAALSPRQNDWRAQDATLLLASGQAAAAVTELRALLERSPRDVRLRIQLADALTAAGQPAAARQTLVQLLAAQPSSVEARQVARAAGLPLPLDPYRVDGAAIIAAFRSSGRRYEAPSVVVLDRSVARVSATGEQMMLTHNIVLVQTKEGIDHWGEVAVSDGAEILFLRTHKPDGTTREAEQISGKETISAADLAIGDYLEWETLETKPASDAFPGGFLGDRFFFRSFDAPLDRSEFIVVTPAGMPLDIDRRVGAPEGVRSAGPEGTVVTRFATGQIPQLFAERSAVPAIAYVPSVRISSGVTWGAWTHFLQEQLYGTTRTSPGLRQLAANLAREVREHETAAASAATVKGGRSGRQGRLAAAIVAWVTGHIEAADELRDPASLTLARGRGNRLALVLALARELNVPARVVLARSRLAGDGRGAGSPQELEEFSDPLVAFDLSDGSDGVRTIYADVRLRYATFGYLPPNLDGAHILALDSARLGQAESRGWSDQRTVDMTIRLDEEGGAQVTAAEELTGWPALEWSELIDRLGADRIRLRQDFEQRWLGVNFPGARLKDLQVDFLSEGGPRPTAAAAAASGSRAVRLRYTFFSPNFGLRSEGELKLSPTFFRSQPGRRFAAEPTRQTTLLMGYDVPFRMTAIVQLPRTARVIDTPTAPAAGVISRRDGYRFVEERTARAGAPDVLILHREAALPIMRVSPEDYGGVAADLRRVDSLEQQEIRIRLPAAHGVSP